MREPDRAAAELRDQIVRAIFAVGLHLQGTAEIAADPLVRHQVEKALNDLDGIVRIIWDSVFRPDQRLDDHGPRGNQAAVRTSPVPDAAFTGLADGTALAPAPSPG